MHYHDSYGPSAPELGWVPSPTYLLRRNRILRLIDSIEACEALEIGCGAGALIHELARKGFKCSALEPSRTALQIARHMNSNANVDVTDTPSNSWTERFDCLLAFEVLEHIEDDRAAIAQWREWIKPGGILLLSVPAHKNQWTASDEWAGHYRRYDHKELESLLVDEGNFTLEHFEAYGSPLGDIIDPIRSRIHAKQLRLRKQMGCDSKILNSQKSGIERSPESKLYPYLCSFPGRAFMRLSFVAQEIFSRLGIGRGYLLRARKTASYRENSSDVTDHREDAPA